MTTEVLRGYVCFDVAGIVLRALSRMMSSRTAQRVLLQERHAKVHWKSSQIGTQQKIVFRDYFAKVLHKAALKSTPAATSNKLGAL